MLCPRIIAATALLLVLFITSLFIGVNSLSLSNLLEPDKLESFFVSHVPRTIFWALTIKINICTTD